MAATVAAASALSGPVASAQAESAADTTAQAVKVQTARATTTTENLDAYWTPERVRRAKPAPVPAPDHTTGDNSRAGSTGAPVTIPATAPEQNSALASTEVTLGRLIYTRSGAEYLCSATVVSSGSKSVIATARHCGFGSGGANYRYAPNYRNGQAPYGWWDAKHLAWVVGGDHQKDDSAFILLSTKDGKTVEGVVGGSAIGFNHAIGGAAYIQGIPGSTDTPTMCNGQAYKGPSGQQLMNNCQGLSGGASGGSFVDKTFTVTGAFSGSLGEAAAASHFDNSAREAFNKAQSGTNPKIGKITGIGGKCVDVASANSADGTQVQLWTCNGTYAQHWTIDGDKVGAFGKCLDVRSAGTANGTRVQLWTCNGTGAQKWTYTSAKQLKNPQSGKCLDATGKSSADGTPLQIWSCSSSSTNQKWTLPA